MGDTRPSVTRTRGWKTLPVDFGPLLGDALHAERWWIEEPREYRWRFDRVGDAA